MATAAACRCPRMQSIPSFTGPYSRSPPRTPNHPRRELRKETCPGTLAHSWVHQQVTNCRVAGRRTAAVTEDDTEILSDATWYPCTQVIKDLNSVALKVGKPQQVAVVSNFAVIKQDDTEIPELAVQLWIKTCHTTLTRTKPWKTDCNGNNVRVFYSDF